MKRTDGKTFKAFYADDSIWKEGYYHDGCTITINASADEAPEDAADGAVVTLDGGDIYDADGTVIVGMEEAFDRWLQGQPTTRLICEIPSDRLDHITQILQANGATVLNQ